MTAVTVIIPAYNRAHLIGAAIDSVLAQEMPADWSADVLVVDDGSFDDLAGALRPYGDRVVCLRQMKNAGAASARNAGIKAAAGEYLAFLDSDDIWLPGKLAAQVSFMQAHDFPASCSAYFLHRPNRPVLISPRYATGEIVLSDLVWGCFVSPGSTLVCRRKIFDEIGSFDTSLKRLEDWDWLLRYARSHTLGFLAQPLARIEVAPNDNIAKVMDAAGRLKAKHIGDLGVQQGRHFLAALELEKAAAYFRAGRRFAALPGVVTSLLRVPFGNVGLASVLHNYRDARK